jgi:bacteriorhodopsin
MPPLERQARKRAEHRERERESNWPWDIFALCSLLFYCSVFEEANKGMDVSGEWVG